MYIIPYTGMFSESKFSKIHIGVECVEFIVLIVNVKIK